MRLLANGCSFTEGYDLPSKNRSWPWVLGENIGHDVVNLALGGASNSRIFRTTLEYLNENDVDLVLIGWTVVNRSELTHRSGLHLRVMPDSCLADTSELKEDLSEIHKFWATELYNHYINYRSWIHSVLHLQDYFVAKKIKYKFFSALGGDYLYEFLNDSERALRLANQTWQPEDQSRYKPSREKHILYQELRRLIKKIDLNSWIGRGEYNMYDYLAKENFKTDSTGHYLEDGHKAWAMHLSEHIT